MRGTDFPREGERVGDREGGKGAELEYFEVL